MGGLINVMEPCCAAGGGGGGGGISIGDSIGGGTAYSVPYIDASGNLAQDNANFKYDGTTATMGGLGLTSSAHSFYKISYVPYAATLSVEYNNEPRAAFGLYGLNLNVQTTITWGPSSNHVVRDTQVMRFGPARVCIGTYTNVPNNDGALAITALHLKPLTSGTLPIAPVMYDQCLVVDALMPIKGMPVVGGGGVAANVIWISPNWIVM